MAFLKYVVIFIFLRLVIASPQINLYFTDRLKDEQSDVFVQENCLYITAMIEKESNSDQIIPYCMSESVKNLNIQNNDFNQVFNFAELYEQKITGEELYLWSTPIDIIEHYQIFLNQLPTSMKTSMAKKLFYNCSLPRFGPYCQYEFDNYILTYSSLNEMMNDYYLKSKSKSNTLTCYIHLECNRGSYLSCLDWSEICDGKIDCYNNGIDEKYCWQLEINECNENEYRCSNGQCIPLVFFRDNSLIPDCLDGSDEVKDDEQFHFDCSISIPTFACEDVTCTIYRSAKYDQYKTLLTSSCDNERNNFLVQSMFTNQLKSLSDDRWLAFKCIIHMPIPQDPICLQLCENKACDKLIENNCPDIFFIPDVPVLFGNIYFAYTKNDSKYSDRIDSPPQYICFNNNFCYDFLKDKDVFTFNNMICGRPLDFLLIFSMESGRSWLQKYILPTSNLFSKCNSIISNDSTLCDRLNMYRCIDSSKCISIHRLNDGIFDCVHYDDENLIIFNNTVLSDIFKKHFKCIETNKYISYRLIKNGLCDCSHYDNDLCEDENFDIDYIRKHISFQTICDGFTELFPITIDGQNYTDETECEQWICDNIYTHCDGIWNCFNGADEINCHYLSFINCPLNHHICVSFQTKQLTCLSIEKSNDGIIDCIGGTDEPNLCRSIYNQPKLENFYCNKNNIESCIQHENLCDGYINCDYGDDELICDIHRNFSIYGSICREQHAFIRNDVENYLCLRFNDTNKQQIVYFSLDSIQNSIIKKEKRNKNLISSNSMITNSEENSCHRGFNLRIWLDSKINSTKLICLCPPSYYGDKCEYQNERISLTIQFRSLSDSYQIPFIIIIYLIDNSYERLIHSYEQFLYISIKDCQKKFHYYFNYVNRPKNLFKNYSIHIDVYEKISLNYRTSFLFPIEYSFLPNYRLSLQLIISQQNNQTIDSCSISHQCIHGICRKYFNNNNQTFCQCESGWSGKFCSIRYQCMCSEDSLCIGISSNNRSICICPINKFGSRCLLNNTICQLNNNSCLNNGQCISYDQTYLCICSKGFSGKRCEIIDKKMILSFDKNIILSESMFIHFIETIQNSFPKRSTTFKTIYPYENFITIYCPYLFNLMFIELFNKTLYLVNHENKFNQSIVIIQSSDRCQHINEIFNSSFNQLHLLRRIKFYHLPCQKSFSLNLTCFYDDIHICLCKNFNGKRQTNCFEFNHQMKFDCFGENICENDAQCLQDNSICPQTSICICSTCFYGRRCQFTTNGFSLSLDAILGYHIHPNISFKNQPIILKFSFLLTIFMTITGVINGILLIITFKNKKLHEIGSGIYLFSSSIFTLLTMIIFGLKFFILYQTQIENIFNRSFLNFQCILIDFLLRICFHMNNWLHASVGFERAIISIKATRFNKKKSQKTAKYVIFILLVFMIITTIHDPLHRHLFEDGNQYDQNKRIWCIVSYSSYIQIFNSIINIIHFCIPFIVNLISAIVIIRSIAKQKATVQPEQNHQQHLNNQFQKHSRLFIAPTLLVILALPSLIISFASGCMKSIDNSWLFIVGYFLSFISPMITFFLFILPSKMYREEFIKTITKYQLDIQQFFASLP